MRRKWRKACNSLAVEPPNARCQNCQARRVARMSLFRPRCKQSLTVKGVSAMAIDCGSMQRPGARKRQCVSTRIKRVSHDCTCCIAFGQGCKRPPRAMLHSRTFAKRKSRSPFRCPPPRRDGPAARRRRPRAPLVWRGRVWVGVLCVCARPRSRSRLRFVEKKERTSHKFTFAPSY